MRDQQDQRELASFVLARPSEFIFSFLVLETQDSLKISLNIEYQNGVLSKHIRIDPVSKLLQLPDFVSNR